MISKISQKIILGLLSALVAVLGIQILMQEFVLFDLYKYVRLETMEYRINCLGKDLISNKTDQQQVLLDFFEKNNSTVVIFDEAGVVYYDVDQYRSYFLLSNEDGEITAYIDSLNVPENLKSEDFIGKVVTVQGTLYIDQGKSRISPFIIEGEDFTYTLSKANKKLPFIDPMQNNIKPEMNMEENPDIVSSMQIMPSFSGIAGEVTDATKHNISTTGKIIDVQLVDREGTIGYEYRQARIFEEIVHLLNSMENNVVTIDEEAKVYEITDRFTELVSIFGVKKIEVNSNKYYITTMTSMQVIEETIDMMNLYTICSLITICMIAGIISFRYTKKFTDPLIELKIMTEKIAKLDFSYVSDVDRDDEIGDLAKNISEMSKIIESNIEILQTNLTKQDIVNRQQLDFLNNISHELKTPLTILQGMVYGVDDGVYQLQDKYVMDTLHNQIDLMEQFVSQLLGIARFNWSDELNMEQFLLSDIVLKVNHNMQYLIEEKELKLIMDLDESVVIGARDKIELVISNLYSNAIYHSPSKETISITIKDGVFTIKNTGVTILGEDIYKIWEPFFKMDLVRSGVNKRTGLGLYIVKQILERHHSKYSISSDDNSVIVTFTLQTIEI